MKTASEILTMLKRKKDVRWLLIYGGIILFVAVWDIVNLNAPALKRVAEGFVNTLVIALVVSLVTLFLGWLSAISLHFLRMKGRQSAVLALTFVLNLLRSIPQVVGVLFCYVLIAQGIEGNLFQSHLIIFPLMSVCMSLFIFIEVSDLMRERIDHFMHLDFYNAMRVCGIPESRIVNFDILWKNSRIHILNKLISVFGMAVFLQCSADFIISVGLSADVNSVNLPVTLGSLLASYDSKQDILTIGTLLTQPADIGSLFFSHLQGVTVAFLIVFTLVAIDRISGAYAERHRL